MEYDLTKFQLFNGLEKKSLRKIAAKMEIVSFQKDEVVIQESSRGNEIYVLLEGMVSISIALTLNPENTDNLKNKALINLTSEHYPFFGEFAILEDNPVRTATVVASSDCKMGMFSREDMIDFMEHNFESGYHIYRNIARVMGNRLKRSNRDVLKLTTALMLILED